MHRSNAAENPRIVVLDGFTLNPGDLNWEQLEALGSCVIYDRTPPELVIERCKLAEIVLVNKVELPRAILESLPHLRYVGVTATGVNVVDLAAANERGVVVTNVPRYATASVAQMVLAHVLNLTQHVAAHASTVRAGKWTASADWCFWDYPLVELAGLTMGIVGLGDTGRAVANLSHAFGMQVIANTRTPRSESAYVRLVDLDTLFRDSDIISLHCPLNDATRELVNRGRLALMKPTALLINTGRGQLIDEQALADALNNGELAGAGLDVLGEEPPPADNPLLTARNCFITPHIAWATRAARQRLLEAVVENVAAFLAGAPRNVVS